MASPYLLTDLVEQLMFLIRADKKGCGEGWKLILPGDYSSPLKTHAEAVGAALILMSYHSSKIGDDIVSIGNDEGQIYRLGKRPHRFKAISMLGEGVNVRVVPVDGNIKVHFPEPIDCRNGTRSAAGVKQYFFHSCPKASLDEVSFTSRSSAV